MSQKPKISTWELNDQPLSPSRNRGRRSRTPIESTPSTKGPIPKIRTGKKRPQIPAGEGLLAEASAVLREEKTSPGNLRDVSRLSMKHLAAAGVNAESPAFGLAAAGHDQRTRISTPAIGQPPWRKICDLLITARDGSRHTGTGWFISERTLLTAGHCVSVFRPGTPVHGLVRSIVVMAARNAETDPAHSLFGWVAVTNESLRVHPRWANDGDLNFDYGVIILPPDSPLGSRTGYFGYGHFADPDLIGSAPTISGYPDDVPEGTQWAETNQIRALSPTRIAYDIFTATGQSGSPVFFRNNNKDIACGIHNFGDSPFNSGVRINPQVIAQLAAWQV